METKEKYENYEIMLLDIKTLKEEVEKILMQKKPDMKYLEELFLYGGWGNKTKMTLGKRHPLVKAVSLLHSNRFLLKATDNNYSSKVIKALLDGGIDPNLKNSDGQTALMEAARWGRTQVVQELLKHPDIDPNLKNRNSWTALMYAASNGVTQAVQELLKHPDIDPNLQDNEGYTALMYAAENGMTQAVRAIRNHLKTKQ